MKFCILGEVEARDERGRRPLRGPKLRAVLAMLLLQADQPVSPERLAVGLWGEDASADAVKTVHVHVSRLRKALGDTANLETTPAGYCLRVDPADLDAACFERLVQEASDARAVDEFDRAAGLLRQALALWRGPALADVAFAPFAAPEIARLEEQRLAALEARIEADLAVGRHQQLVAELQRLVADHPTRETFTAHLILALYRCGRQSEALDAYRAVRRMLVGQIGVEPRPELRRLHDAVLHQEPHLALERHAVDAPQETAQDAVLLHVPVPRILRRSGAGAFVGRQVCLDQLRVRWAQARDGQASFVLLTGEPGIGKTRLASRFAYEVDNDGGIVLYGRADEDALLPYQPFAEALSYLLRQNDRRFRAETEPERAVLSRIFPDLGGPREAVVGDLNQSALRYEVFESVVSILMQAAGARPVLLVLDDLHWADKQTLLLLRHMLRRTEDTRLLTVAAFRDVEVAPAHPLKDLMIELRREGRYECLTLEGLDEAATEALIADRLRKDVTAGFARRLRAKSEGNAFFLEETLRALAASELREDAPVDEDALRRIGVPEGVAEVILRRIRRLSDLAGQLLTAASVIGPSFRLHTLEQLVAAETPAVFAALDEIVAARLVVELRDRSDEPRHSPRGFTFSHALIREVILEQLTDSHRIWLHQQVADSLERSSGFEIPNPAELAYHYLRARSRVGPEPARRYSIAAARRAEGLFAYDQAADHLREARDLFDAEDEAGRCEVLLSLGRVQWHAGDDGARATFLEAATSAKRRGDAGQLARAALGLGERYFEVTYLGAQYREFLEDALIAIGPGDSRERALLLSRLAVNLGFPIEDAHAQQRAAEAVEMARRVGGTALLAQVLLARHVVLLDVEHIEERLSLGHELEPLVEDRLELAAEYHHWRMYDLLGVGDRRGALRQFDELVGLAERLGQPLFRSIAEGAQGLWAELDGDLDAAEERAKLSHRFAGRAHTGDAESSWASQIFAIYRRRGAGRLADLAPLVRQLVKSGGDKLGWRAALGILYFETGDIDAARAIYARELRGGVGSVPRGMFWLTRMALLSELAAKLDDKPGAAALYEALLPYAARNVVVAYCSFWGPVDGYLAVLAETFGDVSLAARHVGNAVNATDAMGARVLTRELQEHGWATLKSDSSV